MENNFGDTISSWHSIIKYFKPYDTLNLPSEFLQTISFLESMDLKKKKNPHFSRFSRLIATGFLVSLSNPERGQLKQQDRGRTV